jgi:hypothetical protein
MLRLAPFGFCAALASGLTLRWHPLCVIGLFALPLCGAAVPFFAAAKKVTKESSFQPPVPARINLRHVLLELSHHSREHSGVRPKSGEDSAKTYTPFAAPAAVNTARASVKRLGVSRFLCLLSLRRQRK